MTIHEGRLLLHIRAAFKTNVVIQYCPASSAEHRLRVLRTYLRNDTRNDSHVLRLRFEDTVCENFEWLSRKSTGLPLLG